MRNRRRETGIRIQVETGREKKNGDAWRSLIRIFSQPSENASDSAEIDHVDDAKTLARTPLSNIDRQA
jgi:hypothetical protein